MNNPSSPLDTLRQLKEMLDAGALTPAEFEALKQQLVFSPPAASLPAAGPVALPPVSPVTPPATNVPIPPAPEQQAPLSESVISTQPVHERPALPSNDFASAYPAAPAAFSAPEDEPESARTWTGDEFPAAEAPPARNPLALILSIGGVLVFLAVVLYLSLNRAPSERISSTSLTAADTLAAPIETGPQAEQLPQPVAVPETIRVAPASPAPPVPARSATAAPDSAATAPLAPTATDSVAGQ